MPDADQNKTQRQSSRRLTVRLRRKFVLNYKKTRRSAKKRGRQCYRYFKHIYQGVKEKAYDDPRFAVEVAALVVVFFYTLAAFVQNHLLKESVNQQVLINRPVALANGIASLEFKDGVPSKARITVRNFGRTMALRVTPVGHIEVGDADRPAPRDPRCDPNFYAPTFTFNSALSASDSGGILFADWGVADLKRWDLSKYRKSPQKKAIYFVGCIYYESLDHRHYYSDVCAFWQPNPILSPFSPWPTCLDIDRNFVN